MGWKLRVFTYFMILFFIFNIFFYIRGYSEAMSKAEKYMREGEYELAGEMLHSAHSRITGMIIFTILWFTVMAPIIYRYRRMKK
jgi:Na+/H+ antiporter NhaC